MPIGCEAATPASQTSLGTPVFGQTSLVLVSGPTSIGNIYIMNLRVSGKTDLDFLTLPLPLGTWASAKSASATSETKIRCQTNLPKNLLDQGTYTYFESKAMKWGPSNHRILAEKRQIFESQHTQNFKYVGNLGTEYLLAGIKNNILYYITLLSVTFQHIIYIICHTCIHTTCSSKN